MASTQYGSSTDPYGSGAADEKSQPGGDTQPGSTTGERVSETIRQAGKTVRESSEKVGRTVEDASGAVADQSERALLAMTRYLRERPLSCLAVAFGAGFVMTVLLRR